ncbi:MAG TPA: amino acid permease [Gemmatimonadaceae bacterium]|nr:amino acid permease [Gemmatimonadaceae bacterium]
MTEVAPRPAKTRPTRRAPGEAGFIPSLGLLATVALVVGNMVGTSIYTLPASLAGASGPLGLVAWVVTAFGYLFVALVYASLGVRYPRTGGPYVYAREAFGELAGFQTVWAYWVSAVIGNAAITAGVVGYLAGFNETLAGSRFSQFLVAQGLLWGLTLLNVLGVRLSARFQIGVMFANLIPLVLVSLLALPHFDPANLQPFAPKGVGALAAGATLVVWAYSGVESATVPAEEVDAPATIRRGTLIGYGLGTAVFLLAAFATIGVVPTGELAASARPIALVAERTVGVWAGTAIGMVAVVAGTGTLNGWILMAGRIPVSAAEDGLFFRRLSRIHPRWGTPHVALVVGSLVTSATLFLLLGRQLLEVFSFVVVLAVLTTLFPHLYAAAAELMIARRDPARYTPAERRRAHLAAPVAFVFVLYTMYGAGAEAAMWGFLVILAGLPMYVWFATRKD